MATNDDESNGNGGYSGNEPCRPYALNPELFNTTNPSRFLLGYHLTWKNDESHYGYLEFYKHEEQ